jgi:hypothetical protein
MLVVLHKKIKARSFEVEKEVLRRFVVSAKGKTVGRYFLVVVGS